MTHSFVVAITAIVIMISILAFMVIVTKIFDSFQLSREAYSQVERIKAMLVYCQRICDSEMYFVEWTANSTPPNYGNCLKNCLQSDMLKDWFEIED